MIDITISPISHEVSVEAKIYDYREMENLLEDILNRAKYSGESISLWIIEEDKKRIIDSWGSKYWKS